eukprot:TRINITY_DN16_c0_g2_i7.p1 TRINITY_DN16_c0_g2~~TRINITY_DN16_c0_g2_i7.p1  ORF type:complete len:224 (+),score=35.51 TRINITY_DN16_c0_g2_i7:613-1284(+)
MPKSKRDKVFHLTKTKSKGREAKAGLIEDLRDVIGEYDNIYVFSWDNMRNSALKDVRGEWTDSRFFLGRNKVMRIALGTSPTDEVEPGLHKIGNMLSGECGLLVTNRKHKDVLSYFDSYTQPDYARAGTPATTTIKIDAGILEQFPPNMEITLRNLGMPTKLSDAKIHLLSDYTICTEGEDLTPQQAKLLQQFGIQTSEFKLLIRAHWSKKTHKVQLYNEDEA